MLETCEKIRWANDNGDYVTNPYTTGGGSTNDVTNISINDGYHSSGKRVRLGFSSSDYV